MLELESAAQNLISQSTLHALWQRHILDSAQLLRFAPKAASWCDIGSGAGLPGLVIALLTQKPVTLVEPRRLRAEFLMRAAAELGLRQVTVIQAKSERVEGRFDAITARAVAALPQLIGIAHHLSHPGTVWVLPKGKTAEIELAEARRSWQCDARSEVSCTDPDARILVLTGVRAKRA